MTSSILIVGAGPVGLSLALGLARRGVRADVVDAALRPSPFCRAIGVSPRTLEHLEALGVARDLISAGLRIGSRRAIIHRGEETIVHDETVTFPDLPYAPFGVPQDRTEAVLEAALRNAGITVERGTRLTGLEPDGAGQIAELVHDGRSERRRYDYVAGCDGAHSAVRQSLGIAFEGEAFPYRFMLGDVVMDWDVPRGMSVQAIRPRDDGPPDFFVAIPLPGRGRYRVSMMAPRDALDPASPDSVAHGIQSDRPGATLEQLQAVADRLLPGRPTLSDMRWSSLFRISMRLASRYRVRNAFLLGDACHIHPPTGGQGMNTGIQDACNLAWKLALVAHGKASPNLLDSYEAERRPVAAAVIADTVQRSMSLGKPAAPPNRLADTQVLVSYRDGPLAAGSPRGTLSPGDRMPDVQGLRQAGLGYPVRLFDLTRGPWFTLLAFPTVDGLAALEAIRSRVAETWPDLVRWIAVPPPGHAFDDPPDITVVADGGSAIREAFGADVPGACLLRPDGHVGHMGELGFEALRDYLEDVLGLGPAKVA